MLRRLNRTLRRLAREEDGSITMEFMLWLPLLLFWMIFSVAVFNAYLTRNQTAKAAHTLADIVSRKREWSEAGFAELYQLQGRLLSLASEGFDLRVTSVQRIGDDRLVNWSSASDGFAPLTTETFPTAALPAMADLDTIVYTEVRVPWTPFVDLPGLTAHTWSFAISSRPRFVNSIERSH